MRRYSLILSFLIFCQLKCLGQQDSIISDQRVKKAPEELKKLIEGLKNTSSGDTEADPDLEIDGLLFDQTRSKNGREFYEFFFQFWEAPADARNYSIFITEKPFRLNTTMIEIMINENVVFQSFLQPRSDFIEQLAREAVFRSSGYLKNYESIVKQLEGKDKKGTGIF